MWKHDFVNESVEGNVQCWKNKLNNKLVSPAACICCFWLAHKTSISPGGALLRFISFRVIGVDARQSLQQFMENAWSACCCRKKQLGETVETSAWQVSSRKRNTNNGWYPSWSRPSSLPTLLLADLNRYTSGWCCSVQFWLEPSGFIDYLKIKRNAS